VETAQLLPGKNREKILACIADFGVVSKVTDLFGRIDGPGMKPLFIVE
jgi:hypothetical protein